MTRFDSKVTSDIITKIHKLLLNVKTGEQVIDFLKEAEPLFMKEVARFVDIELRKIEKEYGNDEKFLMYIGSLLGAAYVMGFLIARELDHQTYNKLIDIDSIFDSENLSQLKIDKFIDNKLEIGKSPNQIGKMLHDFIDDENDKKSMNKKPKIKRKRDIKIDFDETEL
jgi:hypothetical protein